MLMGSLHGYGPCIGTMNPLTAWSPGFSRYKLFVPPEGGTPNQPKLMGSMIKNSVIGVLFRA